jgi:hypothetical protein
MLGALTSFKFFATEATTSFGFLIEDVRERLTHQYNLAVEMRAYKIHAARGDLPGENVPNMKWNLTSKIKWNIS